MINCIKSCGKTILISSTLLFVGSMTLNAASNGIESLKKTGKAFASVAKKVSPAVVFLKIEKEIERPRGGYGGMEEDLLRHFFGVPRAPQRGRKPYRQAPRKEKRIIGQGSGFIVSKDGYILTNNHVVGQADKVIVKMHDGRELEAKIVGKDPKSDVAVIKIDGDDFPHIKMGDSDKLEVGEWVVAVGNPFGLSQSITAGIVSAKGRNSVGITDYENFIQTDAAINPGNSGGPLVDLDSKVVGMNTAIFSRDGGYMGIGFAIPINMAKSIMDQLISKGKVTRGFLGIIIQEITPDLASMFKLDSKKGILISQVTPDSPAEKSGLKQGDIIVELEGKPVSNVSSFRNKVAMFEPGSEKEITVIRNGNKKTLNVKIGTQSGQFSAIMDDSEILEKIGFKAQNLDKEIAERFGYQVDSGVLITEVLPGTPASQAGLRPGNLVVEINKEKVSNVNKLKDILRKSGASKLLLLVKDGNFSRFVVLKLE